jgi:2-methylcitrate dehydratase PrpD
MKPTEEISRFVSTVSFADLDETARRAAKQSMLDGIGLAVAGSVAEAVNIVIDHVVDGGTTPQATLLGSGRRMSARHAALVNGTAIHVNDFDDTQMAERPDRVAAFLTHPTAPVLPAVLALGEHLGSSAIDVLLAYAVGVEVESKIAEAVDPRHYLGGYHTTGTVGPFGSGAAVARLHEFDPARTSMCIGIAGAMGAGFREHAGTMTKSLQAGKAAQAGVVAGDLVARQFDGTQTILEGTRGFFNAAGGHDPTAISGMLGNPWTFASPGVAIKPYPCGALSHPAMSILADMVEAEDIRPEEVVSVYAGVSRFTTNAIVHSRPTTGHEARFSLEFGLASLITARRAGLAEYSDSFVNQPDVRAMIERTRVEIDPWADAHDGRLIPALIRIELVDGRKLERTTTHAKGSPDWPMTDAELLAKFLDCTAWGGVNEDPAREAADRIMHLEDEASLDRILQLLCHRGSGGSPMDRHG